MVFFILSPNISARLLPGGEGKVEFDDDGYQYSRSNYPHGVEFTGKWEAGVLMGEPTKVLSLRWSIGGSVIIDGTTYHSMGSPTDQCDTYVPQSVIDQVRISDIEVVGRLKPKGHNNFTKIGLPDPTKDLWAKWKKDYNYWYLFISGDAMGPPGKDGEFGPGNLAVPASPEWEELFHYDRWMTDSFVRAELAKNVMRNGFDLDDIRISRIEYNLGPVHAYLASRKCEKEKPENTNVYTGVGTSGLVDQANVNGITQKNIGKENIEKNTSTKISNQDRVSEGAVTTWKDLKVAESSKGDGWWGYRHKVTNEPVLGWWRHVRPFVNGRAWVSDSLNLNQSPRWNFIDKLGNKWLKGKFPVSDYINGIVIYRESIDDETCKLADRNGRLIVSEAFNECDNESEYLRENGVTMAVKRKGSDDRTYFFNREGKKFLVIDRSVALFQDRIRAVKTIGERMLKGDCVFKFDVKEWDYSGKIIYHGTEESEPSIVYKTQC